MVLSGLVFFGVTELNMPLASLTAASFLPRPSLPIIAAYREPANRVAEFARNINGLA
jgi:hypothetical protein